MSTNEEAFLADGGAPEYQQGWIAGNRPPAKVSWRKLVEEEARDAGDDPEDIRHWEPRDVDLDAELNTSGYPKVEFKAWSPRRVYFADEDGMGDTTVRSMPRHPENPDRHRFG